MRTRGFLSLLILMLAPPAFAAAVPYSGTLSLSLLSAAPFVATGTGIADVNGSGGLGHLTGVAVVGSNLGTTGAVLLTSPTPPIGGIQATFHNGSASFSGSGGAGFGGSMPLFGVARLCLFAPCALPAFNLSIPLSVVGVGGTANVSFSVFMTVQGAPWTTGSVPFGSASVAGFAHGPASGTSSTAAVSGVVRLVTPIFISTNIPALSILPAAATLDLHFVPEPGTLALLGSGALALIGIGRTRRGRG